MKSRRGAGAVLAAMAGLLLSGCSVAGLPPGAEISPRPPPASAPPMTAACPRDGRGYLWSFGDDRYAGSAAPQGFVATGVLQCTSQQLRSDRGDRHEGTEARAPATAEILAALALPDITSLPPGMACPAVATPTVYLLLADDAGRAYRPRIPITPCHDPRDEVTAAITATRWMTTAVFEVTVPQ